LTPADPFGWGNVVVGGEVLLSLSNEQLPAQLRIALNAAMQS
jgi:hypothetical protein